MSDDIKVSVRKFNFSPWVNLFFLISSDVIALGISFFFSHFIINELGKRNPDFIGWMISAPGQARGWIFILLATLCIVLCSAYLRHYTYRKPFWNELREVFVTIIALAVADLALAALAKWQLSRTYWIILWSLAFVLVPLCRYATKIFLHRLGFWLWPSVIIGSGENAKDAYMAL